MKPVRDVVEAIGRTPLIKLRAASEATGCTILGKAEFMNPGGSVKDRAALAIIEDAVARGALRPGGVDRRGHGGQYRHRHRHGGGRARLSHRHRHPRHPGAGKEGHAAPRRRRTDRGAGRPLFQPEQLREIFRPPRGSDGEDRAERRGLGEPVRQCRQPARPLRDDRAGDLRGLDGEARRLRQRGRLRRHAGRRRHGAEGAQSGDQDRARRSAGRGALFLLHDWRARRAPARRSPRASARAASPPISKARRSISPIRSPTRRRCRSSSTSSCRKGCCSAARPASISPARSGSPANWAPATRSSRSSAIPARATPPNCSIRPSCARRTCPFRTGWRPRRARRKVFSSMTEPLFRADAYLRETEAIVLVADARGIVLDRTVFYPQGGGQPRRSRAKSCSPTGRALPIANTIYDADRKTILHVPAEGAALPAAGDTRDRAHRLGPALQAHARPYRAASALRRRCPIPSPAARSATPRAGSISIPARRRSTRRRSKTDSTP